MIGGLCAPTAAMTWLPWLMMWRLMVVPGLALLNWSARPFIAEATGSFDCDFHSVIVTGADALLVGAELQPASSATPSAPPIRAETFGLRMNLSTVLAPLTWYFALLDRCQLFLVTDVPADDAGDDESLRENENYGNR